MPKANKIKNCLKYVVKKLHTLPKNETFGLSGSTCALTCDNDGNGFVGELINTTRAALTNRGRASLFLSARKIRYYVNRRKDNLTKIGQIRDMLSTPRRDNMNKIVILNPKGGCGKSTLVTNIAAYYAGYGPTPTIMDYDPQGSTMDWLRRRPKTRRKIHGIAAFKKSMQATRSFQLRVPVDTATVIIDSPASATDDDLRELTRDCTSILVPVLPSSMDIHAASRCIADLLIVAKVDRRERKLAVIANRTRKNTRSFVKLMRFLDSLGIPVIARQLPLTRPL